MQLSVTIWELKTTQEPSKMVKRSVAPLPLSPRSADGSSIERDEGSTLKAGLRKVKELTRKATKTRREEESSDGRSSVRSEDAEFSFDTESLDHTSEVESEEEVKEEYRFRKSVSYGSLAYANNAGASFYWNTGKSEDEDLIYYSHRRTDEGLTASELDPSLQQISLKRSILPWKRRKLSFKSPKAKGEPLLKKDCGEEGGDDIDFDRRQLSSSDESTFGVHLSILPSCLSIISSTVHLFQDYAASKDQGIGRVGEALLTRRDASGFNLPVYSPPIERQLEKFWISQLRYHVLLYQYSSYRRLNI